MPSGAPGLPEKGKAGNTSFSGSKGNTVAHTVARKNQHTKEDATSEVTVDNINVDQPKRPTGNEATLQELIDNEPPANKPGRPKHSQLPSSIGKSAVSCLVKYMALADKQVSDHRQFEREALAIIRDAASGRDMVAEIRRKVLELRQDRV